MTQPAPLSLSGHSREETERDGRTAYEQGYPIDANPCHSIVPHWAWWRNGWFNAYLDCREAQERTEMHQEAAE